MVELLVLPQHDTVEHTHGALLLHRPHLPTCDPPRGHAPPTQSAEAQHGRAHAEHFLYKLIRPEEVVGILTLPYRG